MSLSTLDKNAVQYKTHVLPLCMRAVKYTYICVCVYVYIMFLCLSVCCLYVCVYMCVCVCACVCARSVCQFNVIM